MAKGAAAAAAKKNNAPVVKKLSAKDAKRIQDKDDLSTLEEKASHSVSLLCTNNPF